MTTMTFISMIVALILVIVAIARVQGSPIDPSVCDCCWIWHPE